MRIRFESQRSCTIKPSLGLSVGIIKAERIVRQIIEERLMRLYRLRLDSHIAKNVIDMKYRIIVIGDTQIFSIIAPSKARNSESEISHV